MNKTKIEWTDFTWNPVTGCWGPGGTAEKPNRCPYCYAQKIAFRFWERFRPTHDHPELWALMDPFAPTFHPDRLSQPAKTKKPSKIFVVSMGDLFGDWVDSVWINAVLGACGRAPQHVYQFLTKNPRRLEQWNGLWPPNCIEPWAIIGAQTGSGPVKPKDECVSGLIHQYRAAGVPIFLKDNLYPPGAPSTVKIQEWPNP